MKSNNRRTLTTTDDGSFCSAGKRSVLVGKLNTTSHKMRMKELHGEGHKEQTDSEMKRMPQETFGMQLGLVVSGSEVTVKSKIPLLT